MITSLKNLKEIPLISYIVTKWEHTYRAKNFKIQVIYGHRPLFLESSQKFLKIKLWFMRI